MAVSLVRSGLVGKRCDELLFNFSQQLHYKKNNLRIGRLYSRRCNGPVFFRLLIIAIWHLLRWVKCQNTF
jgi:hypothetical protein